MEVVCAINPNIHSGAHALKKGLICPLRVGFYMEVGAQSLKVLGEDMDFGLAEVSGGIEGLAMEVFYGDRVGVAEKEPPDAHGAQIECGGRP
jgi:hypothetical protein